MDVHGHQVADLPAVSFVVNRHNPVIENLIRPRHLNFEYIAEPPKMTTMMVMMVMMVMLMLMTMMMIVITATLHVSGLPTEEGFGVRLGWTRIPWEEKDDLVDEN